MKTNNSFVIIFFYLISVKIAVSQVAWPLSQFNEQHAVVGSVGEYRNTNRFHRGTDISGTGNVYAINSGEVTDITDEGTNNETVWVGNIAYVHVVHSIGIKKGKTVTAGVTVLGTVYSNHVHIQQNNFNFLSHGLSPYVDNISPVINYVEFRQNGADLYTATTLYNKVVTINDVDYTMLYDKVDIIADAKDPGDNGSRMAPISLSYLILNSAGIPVDDWVNSFNFRFTPENTRTRNCFYSGTIQAGVFKYILTSSPNTGPADRYLLTRLDKKTHHKPVGQTIILWLHHVTLNPIILMAYIVSV
jgi:hypothetical protein